MRYDTRVNKSCQDVGFFTKLLPINPDDGREALQYFHI